MPKIPQRSAGLAGGHAFNHNSQEKPTLSFLADFLAFYLTLTSNSELRPGFLHLFRFGLLAVPGPRQWSLTGILGFCFNLICSLVIAALPFCLFCLAQNKIIATYPLFNTLKRLEEQDDNVCKSFEPFWRKSLSELYSTLYSRVLPGMKGNFSPHNLCRFYNSPLTKIFFFSGVPSVPISINISKDVLYWHFLLVQCHHC